MAFIYTSIPNVYEELGSVAEEYDDFTGDWNCRVVLRTDWNKRFQVYTDIMGREWPWITNIDNPPLARHIVMRPQGCDGAFGIIGEPQDDANLYEFALLTVDYTNSAETSEVSETMQNTSTFIKLSYTDFKWETPLAGETEGRMLQQGEAPGILFWGGVITRVITGMPIDFDTSLIGLQGTTNEKPYTFDLLEETFDPQKLLYTGPRIDVKRVQFTNAVKVTQKFHFREIGWNHFYRPNLEDGDQIVDDSGNVKPVYTVADWIDLPRDAS